MQFLLSWPSLYRTAMPLVLLDTTTSTTSVVSFKKLEHRPSSQSQASSDAIKILAQNIITNVFVAVCYYFPVMPICASPYSSTLFPFKAISMCTLWLSRSGLLFVILHLVLCSYVAFFIFNCPFYKLTVLWSENGLERKEKLLFCESNLDIK